MVMDAQVEVSYTMETNRPALSDEERDLALSYLCEDILQSLINMHCPKQGQRNRDREVGSLETSSSNGLEALSVHASAPEWQDSDCLMTHPDTLSCHKFSNNIMMIFDAETSKPELEAKVKRTIEQFMTHSFYTNQVNLRLAEMGSSLHITGFQFETSRDRQPTLTEPEREEILELGIPTATAQPNIPSSNVLEQQVLSEGRNNHDGVSASAIFFAAATPGPTTMNGTRTLWSYIFCFPNNPC